MNTPRKWAKHIIGHSVFYITDALCIEQGMVARAIIEYNYGPDDEEIISMSTVTTDGIKLDASRVFANVKAAKRHLAQIKREAKSAEKRKVWILKRFRNFDRRLPNVHRTPYALPMQFDSYREVITYLKNKPQLRNYTPVKVPLDTIKKGA